MIWKPWTESALPLQTQQTPSVFGEWLRLGAAGRANWEALINGQCLFLTQVVFLHIKVAAFMEVSLIEL